MTDLPASASATGASALREERRARAGQRVREALVRRDGLTRAMVDGMDDQALEDLTFAIGAVCQEANRMLAVVAAAAASRSRENPRGVGFARLRGHRNAPDMLEKQGGVSGPEARRLIEPRRDTGRCRESSRRGRQEDAGGQ
ncbi:hypothetical protein [Demequina litorisediminis]|uniref:ANTAR domain-containing protein n=1 Tax=Demequina litorisediminis TaxID=1849022 RepID=A0ABQ6IIF2_9MICO|nr:hypothetical protein [Demequina litorisediminis]GMA37688.1 hypothetical protein GCM10025876_38920 [Demequina litorisediminis]